MERKINAGNYTINLDILCRSVCQQAPEFGIELHYISLLLKFYVTNPMSPGDSNI
jgi:hypothetical protein